LLEFCLNLLNLITVNFAGSYQPSLVMKCFLEFYLNQQCFILLPSK